MSGAQLDRILWLHSMSGGTYWAQNDAECYPTPLATDIGKGGSFLWAVESSRYPDGSRPRPLWGADVSGLLYTLNYREHEKMVTDFQRSEKPGKGDPRESLLSGVLE